MDNIINVEFKENQCGTVYTKKVYQYDRGVVLRLIGITVPETYQVHFASNPDSGVSANHTVSGNEIPIPDAYFETGSYVYIWIYMTDEDSHTGTTRYSVIIPVEKRPAILEAREGGSGKIAADLDEENHALVFRWI